MIQRIDPLHPKTVTNYGTIDDVKSIYSLLAINILTLRNGIKEGNFSEILRNIIEQLCEEENESRYKHRKIRRILELDDDEMMHSTGLKNAIAINEITKEETSNNKLESFEDMFYTEPVIEKKNEELVIENPIDQKSETKIEESIKQSIEGLIEKNLKQDIKEPIKIKQPNEVINPQEKKDVNTSLFTSKNNLFK